ncbi:ethanolamine ammonia-lyase light chain [Melghirimyces profundicolus]|uniref:Ethanolamine ammonia-lyase small subunit n=1 Tax=Melghirimyces profundicolus TaxID=1242148 RepID=A0A2T6C8M8_9BACL|nr:ethanolamine ammonia-lyase subunit EutC [Melghirimyces profundicolus]PTX64653.1 ethanolamine ammonia-lyase light chain [Melghirimyces profundicolus]
MGNVSIEEIVNQVLAEIEKKNGKQTVQKSSPPSKETIVFSMDKKVGVDKPRKREAIDKAQAATPARIGIGRAGTRMKTDSLLKFRIDHAAAQDAVFKDVSEDFLKEYGLPLLKTKAESMEEYLMDLDSGRRLNEESAEWIRRNCPKNRQVQIVVADGLSSTAIETNIPDLLPSLMQGLELKNITVGKPIFIKRGRVWVQDEVASLVNCDVIISLIGERPGLATAESVSAYLVYRPSEKTVEADRTVISNIHKGGTPPVEAGAYLADVLEEVLQLKVSGVKYAKARHRSDVQ